MHAGATALQNRAKSDILPFGLYDVWLWRSINLHVPRATGNSCYITS